MQINFRKWAGNKTEVGRPGQRLGRRLPPAKRFRGLVGERGIAGESSGASAAKVAADPGRRRSRTPASPGPGPAAAFKGPPRGRATSPGSEAVSRLRLRSA